MPVSNSPPRPTRCAGSVACAVLVLSTLVLCLTSAAAQDSDRQFIDGLLQRRLFDLAERYCQDELARQDISDSRRAELTAEWIRALTAAATHAGQAQREAIWEQAHRTADQFLAGRNKDPFAALVRRQEALIYLTRGELLRFESETSARPTVALQAAREQLRRATRAFEILEQQLDQLLVELNRQAIGQRPIQVDQVQILRRDVRRNFARSLLNQALCFGPDSPDRTSALSRATRQFRELAAATEPVDWQGRLGLLKCYRLAGDRRLFQETMELYHQQAPPSVQAALQLERVEGQLAAGQIEAALATLRDHQPPATPSLSARWDYVHLQAMLKAWQAGRSSAQDWQQRCAAQVQRIRDHHGPFWTRRAEGLLGQQVSAADVDDLALLLRAAEAFYRADQWDEALAAYDRAREMAGQASDDESAVQASLAAAAIAHRRKDYADARSRFRQLSLEHADHPRAAEAHWLATMNQSQVVKTDPTKGGELYVELLHEHLAKWPSAPTAEQATWWLANYQQARHKWPQAISAFKKITDSETRSIPALTAIGQCYAAWLQTLDARQGRQAAQLTDEAAKFFEAQLQADQKTSPRSQLAAVEASRFQLDSQKPDFDLIISRLREVLDRSSGESHEWTGRAQMVLVLAYAMKSSQWEAAHRLIEQGQLELQDLLKLSSRLSRQNLARGQQGESRARLLLAVIARIEATRGQLPEARQRELSFAKARALAAAGQRADSLSEYQQLVDRYSSDTAILEAYATLLVDGTSPDDLQQALQSWREVERRSRPGSEAWFRAKYWQAVAHHRRGNSNQALRIIKLIEVLHPELGGQEQKAKFAELRRLCQSQLQSSP